MYYNEVCVFIPQYNEDCPFLVKNAELKGCFMLFIYFWIFRSWGITVQNSVIVEYV